MSAPIMPTRDAGRRSRRPSSSVRLALLLALLACGSPTDSGDPSPIASTPSCKRGIAYGYHSLADLQALSASVSWWYNWANIPDADVRTTFTQAGVEFVPMVWGQGSLSQNMADIPPSAKYLLAFNEPNFGSQANLTPQQAAALWPQVEAIAHAHNLKIVSPALNYCGGSCNKTSPFDWFDEFFENCAGCQVDYLAVHWYACSKSALQGYIGQMKKYNKPIWLTEFACLDQSDKSLAVQEQYIHDAVDYLESEPAVFRYAWFTGRSDDTPTINLLGASGQLTELGRQYVESPGAACE